jgi:hypothetical protein
VEVVEALPLLVLMVLIKQVVLAVLVQIGRLLELFMPLAAVVLVQ